MDKWKYIVFGLACGLLASGLVILISSPPKGVPIQLAPPPTPSPLVVDISGAVQNPGVYELPQHSRILDVVELAGGLLSEADPDTVNMAAKLIDGQKIIIPLEGENFSMTRMEASNNSSEMAVNGVSEIININLATQADLESLPGLGPSKSKAIIDYRAENGPFATIEDLLEVPGIGEKTIQGFLDLIVIQ